MGSNIKYHVKRIHGNNKDGTPKVFEEYYECPQCFTHVKLEDEYCRRCGQHFDLIEEVTR